VLLPTAGSLDPADLIEISVHDILDGVPSAKLDAANRTAEARERLQLAGKLFNELSWSFVFEPQIFNLIDSFWGARLRIVFASEELEKLADAIDDARSSVRRRVQLSNRVRQSIRELERAQIACQSFRSELTQEEIGIAPLIDAESIDRATDVLKEYAESISKV
jgi:hypothetical protein